MLYGFSSVVVMGMGIPAIVNILRIRIVLRTKSRTLVLNLCSRSFRSAAAAAVFRQSIAIVVACLRWWLLSFFLPFFSIFNCLLYASRSLFYQQNMIEHHFQIIWHTRSWQKDSLIAVARCRLLYLCHRGCYPPPPPPPPPPCATMPVLATIRKRGKNRGE